jgi:hypothetical protein
LITNFLKTPSIKILHQIKIPDAPSLIDPLSCFWLFLCLGCSTSLLLQEEWLAFLFVCLPLTFTLYFLTNRYFEIYKLNYFGKNLEIIKKIINTPVMEKDGENTYFTFITCSDRVSLNLEKMIELSEKRP